MATLNDVITKLNEKKVAKAGDTMTGNIILSGVDRGLFHDNLTNVSIFAGGTNTSNGGSFYAIGGENSNRPGYFVCTARTATKSGYQLIGTPDGTLTWGGKTVNVGGVYITQTWVSGTSWYRVWSDGYIEQGGQTAIVADFATCTVTLTKSFSNSNYTVAFSNWRNGTADDAQWNSAAICNLTSKGATSFQIYNRGATDGGRYFSWVAMGY